MMQELHHPTVMHQQRLEDSRPGGDGQPATRQSPEHPADHHVSAVLHHIGQGRAESLRSVLRHPVDGVSPLHLITHPVQNVGEGLCLNHPIWTSEGPCDGCEGPHSPCSARSSTTCGMMYLSQRHPRTQHPVDPCTTLWASYSCPHRWQSPSPSLTARSSLVGIQKSLHVCRTCEVQYEHGIQRPVLPYHGV